MAKKVEVEVKRIPAIEEFLAGWKIKAKEYFTEVIAKGHEMAKAYEDAADIYRKETKLHPQQHIRYGTPELAKMDQAVDRYWHDHPNYLYEFKWTRNQERISNGLDAVVEKMADQKRKMLIQRTEAKIGQIIDAAGLNIGYTGELEGFLIGETGKARLETITAGGYNIQCFHFRVLIHVLKEKGGK